MEYKEDVLPPKELNECINEYYKSINFERGDWLNETQQRKCIEYISKRFGMKVHQVYWILIKRRYDFLFMKQKERTPIEKLLHLQKILDLEKRNLNIY